MKNIVRGSEWRKWDLHFHTPSSYDYGDKSVTNEKIIEVLHDNEISVVAITDHHLIDIKRIKDLQKLGESKKITVLPGIEFLSDARGKVPVHFIAIFSEKSNLEFIWGQLENRTNISRIKGSSKKENEVYCDLEDTIKIIKELGGIVTIHAGNKSNSIENITHSLPHNMAQKIEIANIVDIYELGKPEDKDDYLKIVFPSLNKHLPMVICSDNHNINKYILKDNCWIKADPTFEGLKQIIYEPKERVRIQSLKPHEKPEYQIIDSVEITHGDFHTQTLHLNQNMNTIIGGRSTGKSVLLGAIAKKLNCDKEVKFGNEEYTKFVDAVVSSITVIWKDGSINNNRNIEYFPQSYMYRLAKNKNNELNNLIEDIIIQDTSKSSLIQKYESLSSENNTNITNKINKLYQIKNELSKNKSDFKEKGDKEGIENEIKKLNNELKELKKKTNFSEENLNTYNRLKLELDHLLKENENIEQQINKINLIKLKSFINDDISYELVSLEDENSTLIKEIFKEISEKYQIEWIGKLKKVIDKNQLKIDRNKIKLEEISKNPSYIAGIEAFKNNKQFKDVEEKLKIENNKLDDINIISKECKELDEQIINIKADIKKIHQEYFKKIEEIKSRLHMSKEKLEIKAFARFNDEYYRDILLTSINQQSYQGQGIVNINFQDAENFFKHSHDLFEKIFQDSVTLKGGNNNISLSQKILSTNFFDISYDIIYEDVFHQMSEGKKAFVVLMLLLDFSNKNCPILIDQPEDDLDNRAIYTELVRYLKNKKKSRQIILVTHNPNIAVGADSELIIVANQNGVDTPNINNSKFQYTAGSLEHSYEHDEKIKVTLEAQGTKEHVCEILEGGHDAFKKRELKYAILS